MKPLFKPLLIASLLATVGFAAVAQTGVPAGPMYGRAMMHHGPMDPARMQELMATRQTELKAKLQLSAAQEDAWAKYIAAMQPPADMAERMNPESRQKWHAEMQALTTPERIDRMNAMKARRDAEMDKRGAATKVFYAALTAEQQKVFDANTMRRGSGGGFGPGPGRFGQKG